MKRELEIKVTDLPKVKGLLEHAELALRESNDEVERLTAERAELVAAVVAHATAERQLHFRSHFDHSLCRCGHDWPGCPRFVAAQASVARWGAA